MYKVKVIGAGSIGNHLAQAARSMGWDVTICDLDQNALDRTKNEIYPGRYGKWDEEIKLTLLDNAPKGEFDFIFIGTPPDSHIPIAKTILAENPKLILIEKPLCAYTLGGLAELYAQVAKTKVKICIGYDHVIGKSIKKVEELIQQNFLGNIQTLDVEFREYWGGIFKAHPWLAGPHDSYLGYSNRGGGACSEHSHAANLWAHIAHCLGFGKITEVGALLEIHKDESGVDYDKLWLII